MRTTVSIDDGLLAQAKEVAVRSHQSLSSVIEEALRESLARRYRSGTPERISLPVGGNSDDRPLVDILDREALAEALGENGVAAASR